MSAPFVLGAVALAIGAAALQKGHKSVVGDEPRPPDPDLPPSVQDGAGGAAQTSPADAPAHAVLAGAGDTLAPTGTGGHTGGAGGCLTCGAGGLRAPTSPAAPSSPSSPTSPADSLRNRARGGGAAPAPTPTIHTSTASKRDQYRAFNSVATGAGIPY